MTIAAKNRIVKCKCWVGLHNKHDIGAEAEWAFNEGFTKNHVSAIKVYIHYNKTPST